MLRTPKVCHTPTAIRHRRAGECSPQEVEDDERSDVFRWRGATSVTRSVGAGAGRTEGASDLESDVGDECDEEDVPSSITFRKRSPEQRAKAVSVTEQSATSRGLGNRDLPSYESALG